MKTVIKKLGLLVRLGVTTAALLMTQHAMAVGTDPGVAVDNTATVSYSVASVGQTPIPASANFVVDRRVDFDVVRMGTGLTPATLGSVASLNFLDFYVVNESNGDLDLNLAFTQLTSAFGPIYGAGTDDTDIDMALPISISVSAGLDPVGAGNEGTGVAPVFGGPSYIDNLPEDRSIRVRIYATGPATAPNASVAGLSLDASAADPTGTPASPGADLAESAAWNSGTVDNVFANDTHLVTPQVVATESAADGFSIDAPQLVITKTAAVFSDPLSSGRAVPGAVIEYTITLDNSAGAAAADGVSISDVMTTTPVGTPFPLVAGAYNSGASNIVFDFGLAGESYCLADAVDANGDGCTFDAAATTLTIAGREMPPTALTAIDVAAGATVTVSYQVLVPAT